MEDRTAYIKSAEERGGKRCYFAACNSGRGFVGQFGQIFSPEALQIRLLIKGGPGTGKSTLMRRVAEYAEGRGLDCEYYYCSSDTDSIDGVIIGKTVALIDSTAPHTLEPSIPGACDRILDVGAFWRAEDLQGRRGEIEELCARKSQAYRRAYAYLSAAMSLDEECRQIAKAGFLEKKAERAAKKLVGAIESDGGYRLSVGIRKAIGSLGEVTFDSYTRFATRIYHIEDYRKIGSLFLAKLCCAAAENGNHIRVSYSPLSPEQLDGVLFERLGICFVVDGDTGQDAGATSTTISMKRFCNRGQIRRCDGEYRTNLRLLRALMSEAKTSLAAAGEIHKDIERIYSDAMDFSALDDATLKICREIIDNIGKK